MGLRVGPQGTRRVGQPAGPAVEGTSTPREADNAVPDSTGGEFRRSRQGRGVLPTPPRLPRQGERRREEQQPAAYTIRLVEVVKRSCLAFSDLPIEFALDLAGAVFLSEPTARVVGAAVAALLTNVRQHAAARMVVIHADALISDHEWEVTVCDDGCGFAIDTTPRGFGLAVCVQHALSVHGVSTMIATAPGEGTTVILRGPLNHGR